MPAQTSRSGVQPPPEASTFGQRLDRADLPHETGALARALIGKTLVHRRQGTILAGRIVETEAYVPSDPASHAFRGVTPRNRVMFGASLHAYVYFIYGANWCLNVTADDEGVGAAVLLRACEPLSGIEVMRTLRARAGVRDRDLARGPGNLCRAFGVGPEFDGLNLASSDALWLADDGNRPEVGVSARIGLTKAADVPLRFYARGHPCVSGPRALSP